MIVIDIATPTDEILYVSWFFCNQQPYLYNLFYYSVNFYLVPQWLKNIHVFCIHGLDGYQECVLFEVTPLKVLKLFYVKTIFECDQSMISNDKEQDESSLKFLNFCLVEGN
ncbi:hypothetical protein RF11_14343 [Thelohanellus kitauei]|uniref:Uncharacterized protein n=1 Tax=Thelohanellus kitauei TaxID=669202 RepID=A0A0C2M4R4_THEKT|nr:hypothetical protein RF11_14343 [Thelohanellus kitauei]